MMKPGRVLLVAGLMLVGAFGAYAPNEIIVSEILVPHCQEDRKCDERMPFGEIPNEIIVGEILVKDNPNEIIVSEILVKDNPNEIIVN